MAKCQEAFHTSHFAILEAGGVSVSKENLRKRSLSETKRRCVTTLYLRVYTQNGPKTLR